MFRPTAGLGACFVGPGWLPAMDGGYLGFSRPPPLWLAGGWEAKLGMKIGQRGGLLELHGVLVKDMVGG